MPAAYHNGAGGFSFADGHAEIHKWKSSLSTGRVLAVTYNDIGAIASGGATEKDIPWVAFRTPRKTATTY